MLSRFVAVRLAHPKSITISGCATWTKTTPAKWTLTNFTCGGRCTRLRPRACSSGSSADDAHYNVMHHGMSRHGRRFAQRVTAWKNVQKGCSVQEPTRTPPIASGRTCQSSALPCSLTEGVVSVMSRCDFLKRASSLLSNKLRLQTSARLSAPAAAGGAARSSRHTTAAYIQIHH